MSPSAEAVRHLLDQRQRQGLPPKATDPATLAKVAAILATRKAS